MKRGSPLVRRTPLLPGGPLVSHTQLRRGGPLNPVSVKRREANAVRAVVVSAMREAAHGRCARCGNHTHVDGHERRGGSYRVDSILSPDCLLCRPCNRWCEDHPTTAAWTGWKVSPKHPHDPALEPWEARALDGTVVDLRAHQPAEQEAEA